MSRCTCLWDFIDGKLVRILPDPQCLAVKHEPPEEESARGA